MKLHALDPLLYPLDEDTLHTKSKFVDRFYELVTESIKPPYAISLDGLWGTGKTSVMKMLESKLKNADYPTFWFNPWEYRQTESVVLAFLQCLASENKNIIREIRESGGIILQSLLEVGMDVVLKVISKGNLSMQDIRSTVDSVTDSKPPSFEEYKNTIESIKKEFLFLIDSISKNYENKPIIIFFDDLDRCLPDDAIQLLEALKNLFVTPGCKCIFICGIDTHIAKQFITEHYHGIEETFSINYFRKIFNLTISMPFSPDIYDLLLKQIKTLFEWDDKDNQKAESLARVVTTRGLQTNIYSVRKYLNIISNFYVFLKFNPDYDFNPENDFIINLMVLKEAWQSLYEELIKIALKDRSVMKNLTNKIKARYRDDKKFVTEKSNYLTEYLGENSPFAEKRFFEWLVKYPTLA